jgi:DNA helicase HerA-like ATPase
MSGGSIVEALKSLASIDIFTQGRDVKTFVGRPFYFDYSTVKVLVNDKWKNLVEGIPAGSFLLCAYDGEAAVEEMVLVRVIGPTSLPTDSEVIASMVEYYKENPPPGGAGQKKLDTFTRYEFNFSGLECRVLGTYYRDADKKTVFGADVENFYSAHNYSVFKPKAKSLEYIVNYREGDGVPGGPEQVRLGTVRYSASRRQNQGADVPIYVSALDFVGKRTALFGMTRTGKSNTVKKVLESIMQLSGKGVQLDGKPLKPVGQIIFDINGEYANANQQDQGTAIFEMFKKDTVRYSLLEKPGFTVMKLNFHKDIEAGFGLLQSFLAEDGSDYSRSFLSIDLSAVPEDDFAAKTRRQRLVAAYQACLAAAGFALGSERIRFEGKKELNELAGTPDPKNGLTAEQAITWFTKIWDAYNDHEVFADYRKKGREWADEDLKAVLVMLTRKKVPGHQANVSGFRKLQPFRPYHSATNTQSFEDAIVAQLREGKVVIIDLSQGDPKLQATYAERICKRIFSDGMDRFIRNEDANYVQLYFEEAHNLFPKKDDKDLSQVYNRLAKEGAKLRLGLVYATQEVSSISGNVLKNTQNWFVSHLNNRDELREIEKFYDFEDFTESLRRAPDRGFIRMKTYSNAFIVPVQIDRFSVSKAG